MSAFHRCRLSVSVSGLVLLLKFGGDLIVAESESRAAVYAFGVILAIFLLATAALMRPAENQQAKPSTKDPASVSN